MSRGRCALLALFLAALAGAAVAERDTLAIGKWALDSSAFGAPHPRAEYELPDGVKTNTPAADRYAWLLRCCSCFRF